MSALDRWLALACLAATASCGGRGARAPSSEKGDFAMAFSSAMFAEQNTDADAALARYLDLVDAAVASPSSPLALEAVLAATDALVGESVVGLDRLSGDTALSFRAPGGMRKVADGLSRAYDAAGSAGPFMRGAIADAAYDLAMHDGDEARAASWRARIGCAREATVIGPLDSAPLTNVGRATPLEAPTAKLLATYPGIAPFQTNARPVHVDADECDLAVHAASALPGLTALVVDATVPRAQQIGIALEATSAATVVVGGQVTVTRPFDLGGDVVERLGTVDVPAGKVRIVVRIGDNGEASTVRLRALAADGSPLELHAPKAGDAASVAAAHGADRPFPAPGPASEDKARNNNAARALVAAAWLALGEGRSAEHLIEATGEARRAVPHLSLLYTRAVDEAGDLPEARSIERSRDAYESVLAVWPRSWEALVGHARLSGQRHGSGEGRVEMLRDLAEARKTLAAAKIPHAKQAGPNPERDAKEHQADPVVRAFEGAIAAEGNLADIAHRALADVTAPLADTPLLHDLTGMVDDRVGAEQERFACESKGRDLRSLGCLRAKVSRGDRAGALAEIARLRKLKGSPSALRPLELGQYLAMGDTKGALTVWDAMLPAQRTVSVLGLLAERDPAQIKVRLLENLLNATDVPGSLAPLARAVGDDPAAEWEGEGARLVAADRAEKSTHAATLVLRHTERYLVGDGGLVHYVLYDLRRVLGTTDVEQGAASDGPAIEGREARRTLRRRIYKDDGRVLEPDSASLAQQGNSDLSQLQPGDYVEQVVEGWSLPGTAGQMVIDTPDLLPERTSVTNATIEIRRPASLALSMWSHAILGKPRETVDGTQKVTIFTLANHPPRRLEEGVARADRSVAVSFGTAKWQHVGRQIGEAVAALADRDPYVTEWAKTAAAGAKTPRAIVDKLVEASGKSIKIATGGALSDMAAAFSPGSQNTGARTMLELGQGSRSWVVYRALGELGIRADIVIAERVPFSADPNYPPHLGRFDYPLVIAHLDGGDVWLDLDVQGPPLPAGRVSPELRGRTAMTTAGVTINVTGMATEDARDEVDVRLKLDEKGNAAGTLTVLLRGRTAQQLADAFEKVVGSDRRDLLRSVVLGWLPWANVNDVVLSSTETSWQVSLRAEVSIPGYAQQERSGWVLPGLEPLHAVFPRALVATLGSSFATQGDRENALSIGNAFLYHVHRRVELTAGAKPTTTLPDVSVKNPHLDARRKAMLDGNVIDEEFSLSIPTGTVGATEYPEFAAAAHRTDDGFMAATRVSVPK